MRSLIDFRLLPSAGECKSASTAGKRRTVIGSESIFRSALRDQRTEAMAEGNSGAFVLRLDSPLTAITAIAVAICLLIITIFSIIFAVLQVKLMPDLLTFLITSVCVLHLNCSAIVTMSRGIQ